MELEQITRFTTQRGYPPRIISALPSGKGEVGDWVEYALFVSKQEGYSYTLVLLTTDKYLLLRTCEQDFHHLLPGSGWFLRPEGQYLGWTHLGWTHGQLQWFFTWWRTGDPSIAIISRNAM
jgi:hypothetical protein